MQEFDIQRPLKCTFGEAVSAYQSNDFSSLSNDFKVLEAFQHKVDVEGKYGNKINHIHWLSHKSEEISFEDKFHESEDVFKIQEAPPLVWADDEPDGKLEGEEDDDKVVEKLDDENHPREFNITRFIL